MSLDPIHLLNRAGEQGAESAREGHAIEEDGEATEGFFALVPHAEEVEAAGEDAGFGDAEEETGGEKAGVILYYGGFSGDREGCWGVWWTYQSRGITLRGRKRRCILILGCVFSRFDSSRNMVLDLHQI